MKLPYLLALLASSIIGVSCSSSDGFSCGPGTKAQGSECVVAGGAGGADFSAAGAGGDLGEQAGAAGASGSTEAGTGGQGGDSDVPLIQTPLDCGSRNITGATVVTAPISLDTTWSGVIYLPKGLVVKNEPVLTILSGTKIIVGKGANVEIGFQGSRPKLRALGTVRDPIRLCGETNAPGYWGGVLVRSNVDPSSVLRNMLISDGGGTDFELALEASIVIQGVQVRNSAHSGVASAGFAEGSASLTVSGAQQGVSLTATAAKGAEVPPNSVLTGNGFDLIDIAFTTFDSSVTLRDFGVPYRQQADVNGSKVGSSVVISIEPGVVYQMKHQTLLDFGGATLHALGTSEKPIVFQGLLCEQDPNYCMIVPDDNGHAGGGRINLGGGSDLQLSYVELHSMGWTKQRTVPPLDYVPFGALTIATDSALKVDHLMLEKASGWGVQLSGRGTFTADSQGINVNTLPHFSTFTPNPLSLACGFLMTLPADTQVSGEPRTNVTCYGTSTLTSSWPAGAGPYILSGFTIEAGGGLSLKPGTVLRFLASTTLRVQKGGTLHANGTDAASVQLIEDTTPNTTIGNWNALIVEDGASVVLDHTLIDSAGSTDGANIVARGPLTITNSTISNSLGWGLQKAATDTTDYTLSNTFTNNAVGDVSDLP